MAERYTGIFNLLNNPFYAFFRGKDYDFSTLNESEIFLAYADKFNDKFEGSINIDYNEFEEQYLRLSVGDILYNEIVEKFKFCKEVNLLGQLRIVTDVHGLGIPTNISEELRVFLLRYDAVKFEQKVKNKYKAYCREIKKVRGSFGIKCFTTVPPQKNSVMWSYYGNNYKGFNCAFSLAQIVYDLPSIRRSEYGKYICEHIKPVCYKNNFDPNIKISCEKLLKIPIKEIGSSSYIINCVKQSLLIKQSQWRHEHEIRLLIRDNDKSVEIIDRNVNGFKIKFPYLETIYICSRKNVFLRMIGKDTKIHNDAKKLAKNLGRSCVNLIPSKEKNEFISELNIMESRKECETTILTEEDIPF